MTRFWCLLCLSGWSWGFSALQPAATKQHPDALHRLEGELRTTQRRMTYWHLRAHLTDLQLTMQLWDKSPTFSQVRLIKWRREAVALVRSLEPDNPWRDALSIRLDDLTLSLSHYGPIPDVRQRYHETYAIFRKAYRWHRVQQRR